MAWQDIRHWYNEDGPDDGPPPVTWPATVVPDVRFAVKSTPWRWDVYDWATGTDGQSGPELIAADLDADAAFSLVAADAMQRALLAAKAFGSQGETHEGISVSYLIDEAIALARGPQSRRQSPNVDTPD